MHIPDSREELHKHEQERRTTAPLLNITRIFWKKETQEI
jgi:hypothetical protein